MNLIREKQASKSSNPESDEKVNFLKDFNNEFNKGKTSLEKLQSRIWWKS